MRGLRGFFAAFLMAIPTALFLLSCWLHSGQPSTQSSSVATTQGISR